MSNMPLQVGCKMHQQNLEIKFLVAHLGFGYLSTFIVAIIYITLIISMIARGCCLKLGGTSNKLTVEMKLAVVFLFNVVAMTTMASLAILTFVTGKLYLFDIVYFVMDVFSLSNPFLLFAFSKSVRQAVCVFFDFRGNVVQRIRSNHTWSVYKNLLPFWPKPLRLVLILSSVME